METDFLTAITCFLMFPYNTTTVLSVICFLAWPFRERERGELRTIKQTYILTGLFYYNYVFIWDVGGFVGPGKNPFAGRGPSLRGSLEIRGGLIKENACLHACDKN